MNRPVKGQCTFQVSSASLDEHVRMSMSARVQACAHVRMSSASLRTLLTTTSHWAAAG